jgi:hypothetical protein
VHSSAEGSYGREDDWEIVVESLTQNRNGRAVGCRRREEGTVRHGERAGQEGGLSTQEYHRAGRDSVGYAITARRPTEDDLP